MTRRLGSAYELDALIGRGATGEVWRGRVVETGEPIAAKLLRPEYSEDQDVVSRFVQERAILVSLQHPNLVRVQDLVVEGVDLAIVMDLVDGIDLRHHLDQAGGQLPPAEAVRITIEVLDALAVTHAARIFHRDIKPDNVLLDTTVAEPMVRLSDFGIARLSEGTAVHMSQLIGTPEYLAPEVVSSELVSAAADVYAVGILLYELLAGRTPFSGQGNSFAIIKRQVEAIPPPIDGCPPEIWAFLAQTLAKDPTVRPDAVAAAVLLRGLQPGLAGLPTLPKQRPVAEWDTGVRLSGEGSGTIVKGQRSLQELGELDEEPVWVPGSEASDDGRSTRVHDRPVIQVPSAPPLPTAPPAPPVDKAKNRRVLLAAAGGIILITVGVGLFLSRTGGSKDKHPKQRTQAAALDASSANANTTSTDGLLAVTTDYSLAKDGATLKLTGKLSFRAAQGLPVKQPVRVVLPPEALETTNGTPAWGDDVHATQAVTPADYDVDVTVSPSSGGDQEQIATFTLSGITLPKGAKPEATLDAWLSSSRDALQAELKGADFLQAPLVPLLMTGVTIETSGAYFTVGDPVPYQVFALGPDPNTRALLRDSATFTDSSLLQEISGGGAYPLEVSPSSGDCVSLSGDQTLLAAVVGTCNAKATLGGLNDTSGSITVTNGRVG